MPSVAAGKVSEYQHTAPSGLRVGDEVRRTEPVAESPEYQSTVKVFTSSHSARPATVAVFA